MFNSISYDEPFLALMCVVAHTDVSSYHHFAAKSTLSLNCLFFDQGCTTHVGVCWEPAFAGWLRSSGYLFLAPFATIWVCSLQEGNHWMPAGIFLETCRAPMQWEKGHIAMARTSLSRLQRCSCLFHNTQKWRLSYCPSFFWEKFQYCLLQVCHQSLVWTEIAVQM